MTNDLYINGKKVDSFGDWSPQTEHPAIAIQRKEHDAGAPGKGNPKVTKQITFVSPGASRNALMFARVKHYLSLKRNITHC